MWRPCYITCKCSGKAWGFLILNYKIRSTNIMALDSQVLIRYFWCWRLLCAAVDAEGWFGPGCHSTRPLPPITCMMYWSGGQCYWRVLSSEREDENKPVSSPCIVHWVFVLSSKGLMFQETWVDPRVGKMPWSRKWQPTPVSLSGKFHVQRSLVGYSSGVSKNWTRLSD